MVFFYFYFLKSTLVKLENKQFEFEMNIKSGLIIDSNSKQPTSHWNFVWFAASAPSGRSWRLISAFQVKSSWNELKILYIKSGLSVMSL